MAELPYFLLWELLKLENCGVIWRSFSSFRAINGWCRVHPVPSRSFSPNCLALCDIRFPCPRPTHHLLTLLMNQVRFRPPMNPRVGPNAHVRSTKQHMKNL